MIQGKRPPFLTFLEEAGAFLGAFRAAMLTSADRAATWLSCSLLAAGANAEALRHDGTRYLSAHATGAMGPIRSSAGAERTRRGR